MKPRDERAHPVVKDAIERGFVQTGDVYPIDGLPSHHTANEARKSVNAAGAHLGVSVAAWVTDADGNPCYKECQDPDAPHRACFRLFSKDKGRGFVVQQTGGDPSKLKYNPWRRAESRLVDDHGEVLR